MPRLHAILTAASLTLLPAAAIAGPLNPPAGPVAPTQKTLAQVEPRTPLSQATTPGQSGVVFVINQPGSYYLTSNLVLGAGQTAIRIETGNVTLDLSGFTISGQPGVFSGTGISVDEGLDVRNVTIRNGGISGVSGHGIWFGSGNNTRLENISVRNAVQDGFSVSDAVFVNCHASGCDLGFSAGHSELQGCTAESNRLGGFQLYASVATGCTARSNMSFGFSALQSVVTNCSAFNNQPGGGMGIRVSGTGSRIDGNTVWGSWFAIHMTTGAADNLVTRNTVRKGGATAGITMSGQSANNFPGNHVAQIIVDPASPFTATNPWANIEY